MQFKTGCAQLVTEGAQNYFILAKKAEFNAGGKGNTSSLPYMSRKHTMS